MHSNIASVVEQHLCHFIQWRYNCEKLRRKWCLQVIIVGCISFNTYQKGRAFVETRLFFRTIDKSLISEIRHAIIVERIAEGKSSSSSTLQVKVLILWVQSAYTPCTTKEIKLASKASRSIVWVSPLTRMSTVLPYRCFHLVAAETGTVSMLSEFPSTTAATARH